VRNHKEGTAMLLSHRRNRHVLLMCILAAAACAILAPALTARADAESIRFPWPDFCATQAPDAIGPLTYPSTLAFSRDIPYWTTPCGRYIFDVGIYPPFKFGSVTVEPWGIDPASDQWQCNALRMRVTLYNLSAGKFTSVADGKFRGEWHGTGDCFLRQVVGSSSFWTGTRYQWGEPGVGYWPVYPSTTLRVAASAGLEGIDGPSALPVVIEAVPHW